MFRRIRPRALTLALVFGIVTAGVAIAAIAVDDRDGEKATEAHPVRGPVVRMRVPRLAHIVVVVFEKKDASEVIGSSEAPYMKSARAYRSAARLVLRDHRSLLRSPALANGAVFITFDESNAADNHIPTLAVGPAVRPNSRFSRQTDHYGLLRTIEQALGMPLLGHSRGAQAIGGIWRSDR